MGKRLKKRGLRRSRTPVAIKPTVETEVIEELEVVPPSNKREFGGGKIEGTELRRATCALTHGTTGTFSSTRMPEEDGA